MSRKVEPVLLLLVGVLVGGLIDLSLGPLIRLGPGPHGSEAAPATERQAPERPDRPALAGARVLADGVQPEGPTLAEPVLPAVELAAPRHAPSSLPADILDLYAGLDPGNYERLLAPVRMYSTLDDLEAAVSGEETVADGIPLEEAARAAAMRRGETRLPAGQFLAVCIPVGPRSHEVFVGQLPSAYAGRADSALGVLAREVGVPGGQVDPSEPSYAEAIAVAESWLRARIRHRLREQAWLARQMSATGTVGESLHGHIVVVLADGKSVVAVPRGADARLDDMVDAYVRAPAAERAALREFTGK